MVVQECRQNGVLSITYNYRSGPVGRIFALTKRDNHFRCMALAIRLKDFGYFTESKAFDLCWRQAVMCSQVFPHSGPSLFPDQGFCATLKFAKPVSRFELVRCGRIS